MKKKLSLLFLVCALSACEKSADKPVDKAAETATPVAPAPVASAPTTNPLLDVGKVEYVVVTSKGAGITLGAAVNEALKTAVMQVNGVAVSATSANVNVFATATATVDTYSDQGHDQAKATAELQGQAFAERIISQSQGIVSTFKVLNVSTPNDKGSNFNLGDIIGTAKEKNPSYSVEIEASVAKFKAPASAGKISIVISPVRSRQANFMIGGQSVPAAEILEPLRRQIVDALAQTGRFTILDRQFEAEIEGELDMISAGKTPNTTIAKLGQAISADLVWVGEIESFAYNKHARKLQTSDRNLVSYDGGWKLSQRLINLATRQIQQSKTLQGTAPSIAPTTLSTGIDAQKIVHDMQAAIVKQATEDILLRSFPITLVEKMGDQVVLSQGGAVLKENSRYRVYLLGKEMTDPQTGQSLGRLESACCEVVVNRVTPTVSYATLENIQIPLGDVQISALQVREALGEKKPEMKPQESSAVAPKSKPRAAKAAAEPAPKEKTDW